MGITFSRMTACTYANELEAIQYNNIPLGTLSVKGPIAKATSFRERSILLRQGVTIVLLEPLVILRYIVPDKINGKISFGSDSIKSGNQSMPSVANDSSTGRTWAMPSILVLKSMPNNPLFCPHISRIASIAVSQTGNCRMGRYAFHLGQSQRLYSSTLFSCIFASSMELASTGFVTFPLAFISCITCFLSGFCHVFNRGDSDACFFILRRP